MPPSPAPNGVVPLESFSENQRALLREARDLAGVGGVIIGAIRGPHGTWDLRPLVQTGRDTVVVRTSAPPDPLQDMLQKDGDFESRNVHHLAQLQEALVAWKAAPLCASNSFSWGTDSSGQRVWFCRPWVASDRLISGDEGTLSEQEFLTLVEQLIGMHGGGYGHGHLVRSNLFRAPDGSIGVLDPCLFWFGRSSEATRTEARDAVGQTARSGDIRAADLQELVDLAPAILKARTQSAVTTGRLGTLLSARTAATPAGTANQQSSKANGAGAPLRTQSAAAPSVPALAKRPSWSQPANVSTSHQRWVVLALVLTLAVVGGGYFYFWHEREYIEYSEAQQFWSSGQPSLMSRVADAAVLGQRSAQTLIVAAAQEGKIPEGLISQRIIRIGFDARWEASLSKSDRALLLRLALPKLLSAEIAQRELSLSAVHPAVLLAALADLDLSVPAPFAAEVGLEGFGAMPGQVGAAFSALSAAGVTKLADPSARALCRLVGGNVGKDGGETEIRLVLAGRGAGARMRALVALSDGNPKLSRQILSVVANGDGVLTELLRWLGSDPSAGWAKTDPIVILGVLAAAPPATLGLTQWADLLSFPEMSVRQSAAVALSQRFLKEESDLVTLLASRPLGLSRVSIATLIGALGIPGEARATLLGKWFQQAPPVEAVKQLLLARQAAPVSDAFNFEAARYLNATAGLTLTVPEIRRLTQYREPLVRALAYSQLTVEDEEQRKVLEEAGEQESDTKLRDGLLERLAEFTRTQASVAPAR